MFLSLTVLRHFSSGTYVLDNSAVVLFIGLNLSILTNDGTSSGFALIISCYILYSNLQCNSRVNIKMFVLPVHMKMEGITVLFLGISKAVGRSVYGSKKIDWRKLSILLKDSFAWFSVGFLFILISVLPLLLPVINSFQRYLVKCSF